MKYGMIVYSNTKNIGDDIPLTRFFRSYACL